MKTIDLVHKEKSGVSHEISRFPDGEVKITLEAIDHKEEYQVKCRIRNAEELFLLMQVADILNRHAVVWYLHIYYLMSMRMDRVMTFNDPYNLQIVANVIKGLGARNVHVYHPHSDKTSKLLGIANIAYPHPNLDDFQNWQLCYPDAGAMERYGTKYRTDYNPLVCEKKRDVVTGKILGIEIKNKEDYENKPVMVVDDLCDAGGTFLGVAEAIRDIDKDAYLGISVFHMVNPKGIENLCKSYDEVYFTNSYNDWKDVPLKCKMFNIIDNGLPKQ